MDGAVMDTDSLTVMAHAETAGTFTVESHGSMGSTESLSSAHDLNSTDREGEQALESHEVIELQAFSHRKAWISDKTKFLEAMPAVELFAGLDAVRTSLPVVPGLPSRAELQEWLAEHDKIEKETEAFDSGELKKFKAFTKAASKRNLSSQDTDLIELTLTTIYEFDKLLHLLRDRSENLDLLGVRLTWEEQRAAAWADRSQILSDLRTFLTTRARWSPSIYDLSNLTEESSHRRGSIMSVASDTSAVSSPGFSRTARFKLAESLSRDAAQFASRITALRHGRISAAGKALDRLIDNSRKPVPEELLDEQDRLEDKGINEMENVGKFLLSVVTQWRRADEIYVETLKDQSAALQIQEEVETAKLIHPSARQTNGFTSRVNAIMRRITARDNPAAPTSSFPRPVHPLFPEQKESNRTISFTLETELSTALASACSAEKNAQEYQVVFEAVKNIETLTTASTGLLSRYDSIIHRLRHGFDFVDGDGSPPDLTSSTCLTTMSHSSYLALLPPLLRDLDATDQDARGTLPQAQAALLGLKHIVLDTDFKEHATSTAERLSLAIKEAQQLRGDVEAHVHSLRQVRKVWSTAEDILRELNGIRETLEEIMERDSWKQASPLPATPESANVPLPSPLPSCQEISDRLDALHARFSSQVQEGIHTCPSLGPTLHGYLCQRCEDLSQALDQVRGLVRISTSIQSQTFAMGNMREEVHTLQTRIEDVRERYGTLSGAVLDGHLPQGDIQAVKSSLDIEAQECNKAVEALLESVSHRIPFVSVSPPSHGINSSVRRRFSSAANWDLASLSHSLPLGYPLDLLHLDDAVRADCNALTIRLAGDMSNLRRTIDYFLAVQEARRLDIHLSGITDSLHRTTDLLQSLNTAFHESRVADIAVPWTSIADTSDRLSDDGQSLSQDLIAAREQLSRVDALQAQSGSPLGQDLVVTRSRTLDDLQHRLAIWVRDINSFRSRLSEAQRVADETARREKERVEVEERARQELQAKLQREQERRDLSERARLEQERLEQERLEQERLKELEKEKQAQAQKKVEHERIEREIVERERTKSEQVEDVFGTPSKASAPGSQSDETTDLLRTIQGLRNRLRLLDINSTARPSSSGSALPSTGQSTVMATQFAEISSEVATLPYMCSNATTNIELRSLRSDIAASESLIQRVLDLSSLAAAVQECDATLSDLLEHIDSYPAPPSGLLSSPYMSPLNLPPEEQLTARIDFTKKLVERVELAFSKVSDDRRAVSEHSRVSQTWNELESMALDRINGRKSRPSSAISSGRQSRASIDSIRPTLQKKNSHYSTLSVGTSSRGRGRFLSPIHPSTSTRRSASNREISSTRSSSNVSVASTNRSTSGPMFSPSSRLFNSTFASRQRTTSLSSTTSTGTPLKTPAEITSRPRAQTNQRKPRMASPTPSETSSLSRSFGPASRSTASYSTWSRAPRLSFSSSPRSPPKTKTPLVKRKAYIANPKNKLDVAVGDIVNNLPVDINIEVAEDSWQDQSGKYWIGAEDPKLCFCRILRSQTVMVRVGGGWMELSKFIKTHFADSFRLLPETVVNVGTREERWISSATLLEAPEIITTPPRPPITPEPSGVPSFSLSTPGGRSPHSIKSTSSPGSPLTPLQFLRRADVDLGTRPSTPSRSPALRPRTSVPPTPSRAPAWKP
ncbi:hypothetical protein OF83DRAFT_529791 [Amylostereum chailletii]|nr:hypothetical protein OF83DRAFT_529791 [Amylostereum chailletii]